jgi:tRNA threonylcarbamoyladenosine biosynthesis protein TsaE
LAGRKRPAGALVLGLKGDLGAGKTTFIQGLAEGLKIKEPILSPTFVILKRFDLSGRSAGRLKNLYHMDCYRIDGAEDLVGINFEEIIKDKGNLIVIEWAEKIKEILPEDSVWLKFDHLGGDRRKISDVTECDIA